MDAGVVMERNLDTGKGPNITFEINQTNGLISGLTQTIDELEKVINSILLSSHPVSVEESNQTIDDIERSPLQLELINSNVKLSNLINHLGSIIHRVNL